MKQTKQHISTFSAPPVIEIKSDGTVLKFISKQKDLYTYRYIKASPKCGKLNTDLLITEENLIKLVKNNS